MEQVQLPKYKYCEDGMLALNTPEILSKFVMKNLMKEKVSRFNQWAGRNMPDFIKCYSKYTEDDNYVLVPSGVRSYYPNLSYSIKEIKAEKQIPDFIGVIPYEYQTEGVAELLKSPVGYLHATTGSGKTIMCMMIMQALQVKTLIVVKDLTLLSQMLMDLRNKMGIVPLFTGGKPKTKKYLSSINTNDVHVTTIQSIDNVDLSKFSCVILDEVHEMLGPDDRRDMIGKLKSKYIYGLTGTPLVNDVDESVFKIYLGRKVTVDFKNITPEYKQIATGFEYSLEDLSEFHLLKKALYEDGDRNNFIVSIIQKTIGESKGIVFCEYIEHVQKLKEMLGEIGIDAYVLIGKVKQDERLKIRDEVMNRKGPCIIIGHVSIIGTGFDLPELSKAYLTTCIKFNGKILQYIGRIIRKFPGKTTATFYDFADINNGILRAQARSRIKTFKEYFGE